MRNVDDSFRDWLSSWLNPSVKGQSLGRTPPRTLALRESSNQTRPRPSETSSSPTYASPPFFPEGSIEGEKKERGKKERKRKEKRCVRRGGAHEGATERLTTTGGSLIRLLSRGSSPRPPRIWTHKHARIVGRHSP